MNDETKYDFASEGWVAVAREHLEGKTKDVDLAQLVFSDAPAHLT